MDRYIDLTKQTTKLLAIVLGIVMLGLAAAGCIYFPSIANQHGATPYLVILEVLLCLFLSIVPISYAADG